MRSGAATTSTHPRPEDAVGRAGPAENHAQQERLHALSSYVTFTLLHGQNEKNLRTPAASFIGQQRQQQDFIMTYRNLPPLGGGVGGFELAVYSSTYLYEFTCHDATSGMDQF